MQDTKLPDHKKPFVMQIRNLMDKYLFDTEQDGLAPFEYVLKSDVFMGWQATQPFVEAIIFIIEGYGEKQWREGYKQKDSELSTYKQELIEWAEGKKVDPQKLINPDSNGAGSSIAIPANWSSDAILHFTQGWNQCLDDLINHIKGSGG